jgi:hypothetical protein
VAKDDEFQPGFVGPPQSYPEFDGWDKERHAAAERAIAALDGVKSYKNAGGIGVGHKYKPHYVQLMRRGGLSPDEASMLARYKMWRGGKNTPKERVEKDTPAQIDARGAELRSASPERRAEMAREAEEHKEDSLTRFYDDLVMPKKPSEPEAKAPTKKKGEGA